METITSLNYLPRSYGNRSETDGDLWGDQIYHTRKMHCSSNNTNS